MSHEDTQHGSSPNWPTSEEDRPAKSFHEGSSTISRLLEGGEEPCIILEAILANAVAISSAESAALYMIDEEGGGQRINQHLGDFIAEENLGIKPDASELIRIPCSSHAVGVTRYGGTSYYSIPLVSQGVQIGSLVVFVNRTLTIDEISDLFPLSMYAAITAERINASRTVQHLLDRLDMMNSLNKLIFNNASVASLCKSIARECAFRFAADIALMLSASDDGVTLEVLQGSTYGCSPGLLPSRFALTAGILPQVLHLGGHISVQDLNRYPNHNLPCLESLGIVSIDAHCLEVRGESLGVVIIGYRRERLLSRLELLAFHEFCQCSAVALANARSQERIHSYAEKLQYLVDQRTKELEHQTMLAEEANQSKSQFLANMSHELRTPLTAIVGYSSVIKEGIFGPLNERQADAVGAVIKSSEHLKNLIDDVLNLARVESGKEEPEPRTIQTNDLLNQSYKLMMQSAINKGLNLEQPILPSDLQDIKLFADPKHTQQIIINLLSNAIKYTPRGGRVWMTVELVVDKVKITVHDNGVGIPPHKQAALFQRFERGDDAYSKSQEGTGIGLNLTKRLVEVNGGRIGVDSTQGQGSSFWVMLPYAPDTKQEKLLHDSIGDDSQIELSGLSTVVVDDNTDACEVLKLILTKAGATVRIAHNVEEGIALLRESTPDIILTDLAMPKQSGLELIEQVRKDSPTLSDLPIIVLSACAFAADREAALSAGASSFLAKPFQPKEVLKNVRDLTFARAFR